MDEITDTTAPESSEAARPPEPLEPSRPDTSGTRPLPPPPPPPPMRVQLPPAPRPPLKSPVMAVLLGIALGLGHFYIGVYQRAAIIIITFFLSIYLLPPPLQIFAPIFIWFFSLFDAYRQAQLANLGDQSPTATSESPKGTLVFGVFLTVVGAVLLIDQLFPINLEFLRRWWPVLLIAGGVWAIVGALREQRQRAAADTADDDAVETPDAD